MQATADDDRYLVLTELVRYSGLSISTLKRHLKDPTRPIPHARVGGRVLVRRSDFDAWVAQFAVKAKPAKVELAEDAAAIVRSIRGGR